MIDILTKSIKTTLTTLEITGMAVNANSSTKFLRNIKDSMRNLMNLWAFLNAIMNLMAVQMENILVESDSCPNCMI